MPPLPIQINGFNTQDDRVWHSNDQGDILVTHTFQKPYSSPPKIIMGLDFIDVCVGTGTMDTGDINKDTIGIKCTAEEIDEDTFQARIGIWGDGGISAGGCKWIEAAHKNLNNIQSGDFRTTPRSSKTLEVVFDPPFASKPKVLVWLQGFQLNSQKDWDFGGWVVDGSDSENGFKLEVRMGGNTELYQSMFSWMAFEEVDDQILGDRACDLNPDPSNGQHSMRDKTRSINFGTTFTSLPRVVQCISRIKVHNNENGFRIKSPGVNCTRASITCMVRTWSKTSVDVDVSWVAVA